MRRKNKIIENSKGLPIATLEDGSKLLPRMMTVGLTAWYCGISEKTLRNRLCDKDNPFPIKPKRVVGRVVFDKTDIDAYLDSLQHG